VAKQRTNAKRVYKQIGLNVRALRDARGWTLEETEEHGWHNWTHLQKIESGKNITVQTIVNLANLFGVSPSVLFEGT
jgi:hypothetical protein